MRININHITWLSALILGCLIAAIEDNMSFLIILCAAIMITARINDLNK